MYWANFWPATVHVQQNIFGKILIEVGNSHLYASFDIFYVQIGQCFESKWVFEKFLKTVKSLFLRENEVDFEFFWKFKISMWLEWLTNLNVKGAKRSVKMWAINFYMSFFKNTLLCINGRRSKNGSVYTESRKKRNLSYSIRMYWANFWPPTVQKKKIYFFKSAHIEVCSSHLHASFGTFCVQICQLQSSLLIRG